MSTVKITIDGKECSGSKGQTIADIARANGIYIPTLCHYEGLKPVGICRICTVKVNGRNMAACTTPAENDMVIENELAELDEMRKAIVEMLFVEGNHMCPTCEKSGNCQLQALGYKYQMLAPRFPFIFPQRELKANNKKIVLETNRCVQCRRCVRAIRTKDGKAIFGIVQRGDRTIIELDEKLAEKMTDEQAQKAMELCPVGCIIKKEVGFSVPIGKRKYDGNPIGSEIK